MNREDFLKQKIKESGYNLKDFAAKIDMPYTTLLSIVNKSVGGAALDNIIKICNGLAINIEILNPYVKPISRPKIVKKYDGLNPIGKQKADDYINDLLENQKYSQKDMNKYNTEFAVMEDIAKEIKSSLEKNKLQN